MHHGEGDLEGNLGEFFSIHHRRVGELVEHLKIEVAAFQGRIAITTQGEGFIVRRLFGERYHFTGGGIHHQIQIRRRILDFHGQRKSVLRQFYAVRERMDLGIHQWKHRLHRLVERGDTRTDLVLTEDRTGERHQDNQEDNYRTVSHVLPHVENRNEYSRCILDSRSSALT